MEHTHVYPYFPAEIYREESSRYRNIFSSYGRMNHTQLCTNGPDCTFVSQRLDKPSTTWEFKATQPSMPLFAPVDISGCHTEPCFQAIREENKMKKKELSTVTSKLKFFNGYLVSGNASNVHSFLSSDLYRKEVNYMYSGGALKYRAWQSSEPQGILFYPADGPGCEILGTVEICEAKDGTLKLQNAAKSKQTTGGRIYEIDAVVKEENMMCLIRREHAVHISSLTKTPTGYYSRKLLKRAVEKTGIELTSAALSPYSLPEYAQMTTEGACELKSIETKGVITTVQGKHRFDCLEPYWQCGYGMHPRSLIITDRTGVALYDIRRKSALTNSDILTLPHASLNSKERIFVHKRHEKSQFYHLIATSHNLLLIDQRFPNHPVLKWNHLLLTPPVYMEVLYSVTNDVHNTSSSTSATNTTANDVQDDIVLLGCQDSSECHAFQMSIGTGQVHPSWQGLPWRISKPCDFAEMSAYGSVEPTTGFQARLSAPLAGVTGLKHRLSTRFTALQMTSYGDVFYQTYSNSNTNEDKTYNSGPGSCDLALSNVNETLSSDWLKEAEENGLPDVKIVKSECPEINVEDLISDFQKCTTAPAIGCQLCNHSDDVTTVSDVCPRCGNMVEHTQLLCDSLQQKGNKAIPLMTENLTSQEIKVDRHLNRINVDKVKDEDAFSEIITRLWNFEDNIPIDLLRRKEEEFLEQNPSIKTEMLKQERLEGYGTETDIESFKTETESEFGESPKTPPRDSTDNKPRDLASLLNIDLTFTPHQQTTIVDGVTVKKEIYSSDSDDELPIERFSLGGFHFNTTTTELDHFGDDIQNTGFQSNLQNTGFQSNLQFSGLNDEESRDVLPCSQTDMFSEDGADDQEPFQEK